METGRLLRAPARTGWVAGISVPWNSPVALLIRSLAPALAAGCTTVMKMPGQTAQVNALISQVFTEVKSLPRGVINMITGEREVLSYLVESPDVLHPDAGGFRLAPGASASQTLDIMSVAEGLVGAETL